MIVKLRTERNWTQDILAAKLQCLGLNVSRERLSNMESGRTRVTDEILIGLHRVFQVPIIRFFPHEVKILDEKFAQRHEHDPVRAFQQRKR